MATMLYAIVDPAASTVRWVNAGHPPPLVIGGGEARFLQGEASVPLGVLPFPTYEEVVRAARARAARSSSTRTAWSSVPGEHIDDGLARARGARAATRPRTRRRCSTTSSTRWCPRAARPTTWRSSRSATSRCPDRFSAEFPPEPESLAPIRSMLRRWLSHAGADELEIAEITTACGEAATNAIEHAGTGNGSALRGVGAPRRARRSRSPSATTAPGAASARTTTAGGWTSCAR